MDGLSAAGSIIAVVHIGGQLISLCYRYDSSVRSAAHEISKITEDIISLKTVLERFLSMLEDPSQAANLSLPLAGSICGPDGPLAHCRADMLRMKAKLTPAKGWKSLKIKLLWPLQEVEVNRVLESVSRCKTTFQLALTGDQTCLTIKIRDEVAAIKARMDTADVDETRRKIVAWLAMSDPSSNHNSASEKRQAATGRWFTEGQVFYKWQNATSGSLWLYGIPGCGKTVLCSTVIETLRADTTRPLAFYYIDFNDSAKQNMNNLLRSLIEQLCFFGPHAMEQVKALYAQFHHGQQQPTTTALASTFEELVEGIGSSYVVIDALDECRERAGLLSYIAELAQNHIGLKLLVTSRRETDIEFALRSAVKFQVCIQNKFVDADVQLHVQQQLNDDCRLRTWPPKVHDEIELTLVDRANGMFRWVSCQLDTLRKCVKLNALRSALKTLPVTLDDTYARILLNIDPHYQEDALKALQWLCYAARPVRLSELVEVLAVYPAGETYVDEQERLHEPEDIVTICSSLISIVYGSFRDRHDRKEYAREVRLAHFSVKEYLISRRISDGPAAYYSISEISSQSLMTEICLAYLLYASTQTDFKAMVENHPLAMYAAEYWMFHARTLETGTGPYGDIELHLTLQRHLLSSKSNVLTWIRLFDMDHPWQRQRSEKSVEDLSSSLYYAASCGLTRVCQILVIAGANVEEPGGRNGRPLQAAAHKGHVDTVKTLIGCGAAVNGVAGHCGSALQAAALEGYLELVTLLLHEGADPCLISGFYGSPLQAAAFNGRDSVVKTLLNSRSAVDGPVGQYGYPLQAAAPNGHLHTLELLLRNGADARACGGQYGNALQAAVFGGNLECVQLLIAYGADVKALGGQYHSSLQAAAFAGNVDVLKLLLTCGADLHLRGGHYGNAFTLASLWGHPKCVQVMLDYGADVNAEAGRLGTALSAASYQGHEAVARLLLESGAKQTLSGQFGTPLQAAAVWGQIAVLKLLLKHGGDVNVKGGQFGSALNAAIKHNQHEAVRILESWGASAYLSTASSDVIEQGKRNADHSESQSKATETAVIHTGDTILAADTDMESLLFAAILEGRYVNVGDLLELGVNVQSANIDHCCALHAAVSSGYASVVELLIDHGADIEHDGGKLGCPLQAAALEGSFEIIEALLTRGAQVKTRNGHYGDALQAACYQGHFEVTKLLLQAGATIDTDGGQFDNALQAAAFSGHLDIVKYLVEGGADMHAAPASTHYGDALQTAALWGHTSVVRFLLSNGANPHALAGQLGTPLQAAAYHGNAETCELLLKHGAYVQAAGGQFGNALQAAALWGHAATVKLLLESGADVQAIGGQYGNALQAAASRGHEDVVRMLLESGADPSAQGGQFGTALDAALRYNHTVVAELLVSYGE